MRRLISYSILSGALLLGIGITAVPLIEKVNTDIAYSDGRTLYFRASEYDADSSNGNYGNEEGEFLVDTDIDIYGNRIIDDIADVMRKRLDAWSSSEYNLNILGNDTIAVTLRTSRNTELQYQYIERLLSFSGGDLELDASDITHDDYPDDDLWADIIDGTTAYIENYTIQTGVELPTVVIPLKEGEGYQTAFRNLLTYCNDNTKDAETDDDGQETSPATTTSIVIWANRKETDVYADASSDANVASRVLTTINPATAKYVPTSDEDKEESEQTLSLRLVPSSAAFGQDGQYNNEKGAEAYEAASFYLAMINASRLEFDIGGGNMAQYSVSFTYSERADANVEHLVKLTDIITPALGRTMIATLITIVGLILLLVYFERLSSLAGLVASIGTGFASFAIFFAFGSQFNIAALIGLIANVLLGLFGYLYHESRLKVELYRGRTLKKANAEAAKKALWPILDGGIAYLIIGVFLYAFGGAVASKAGVMLAIGGVVSILVNLIVTRFLMWELANDDTAQSAFPAFYRVNKDKIPDPLQDEKQSYFGPFANTNFRKPRKIGLIALCALLLGGIGTSVAFGVMNGNIYNDRTSSVSASLVQLDIRSERQDKISGTTAEGLYAESQLIGYTASGAPRVFEALKVDDKVFSSYIAEITLSETPKTVYTTPDAGDGNSDYWFFYNIYLNAKLDNGDGAYTFAIWDGSFDSEDKPNYVTSGATSIGDALDETISNFFVTEPNDYRIAVDDVKKDIAQPYAWQVGLGLGVGLATLMVYMILRFRPGKGLAIGLSLGAGTFLAMAIFAMTRIPVYPTVSLGAVLVAAVSVLMALFLLNGEKEFAKESKEKEKKTFAFSRDSLDAATRYEAGNILYMALAGAYMALFFFGFGPLVYAEAFAGGMVGILLFTAFLLFGYGAIAEAFMKLFSKVSVRRPSKKKKKKKVTGQLMKKKGAEPEESIFIGIND